MEDMPPKQILKQNKKPKKYLEIEKLIVKREAFKGISEKEFPHNYRHAMHQEFHSNLKL